MEGDNHVSNYPSIPSWVVLVLCIFSLGLYPIWWFYSRAAIVNGHQTGGISLWQIHILAIIAALNVGLEFIPTLMLPELLASVIFWGHLAVYFWVVFCFKSEIESSLYLSKVRDFQISMFLSFILSTVYFQYKINGSALEVRSHVKQST